MQYAFVFNDTETDDDDCIFVLPVECGQFLNEIPETPTIEIGRLGGGGYEVLKCDGPYV